MKRNKKITAFVLTAVLTIGTFIPENVAMAGTYESSTDIATVETMASAESEAIEETAETGYIEETVSTSETEETLTETQEIEQSEQETAEETNIQTSIDMSRVTWDDVPSMGWDDPEGNTEVRKSAQTFKEENGIALFSAENKKKIKAYGIDISQHNGAINWKKVRNAGVDFAIIRVGGRGYGSAGNIYKDDDAQQNIEDALAAGIKVGVYFFSTAINEKEALEEAQYTCSVIRNYDISYPVVYDHEGFDEEGYRNYGLSREVRTKSAVAFMDYVREQGYEPMIYSSAAYFRDDSEWKTSELENTYGIWVAQYWRYTDSNGNRREYSDYEMAKNNSSSYTGRYTIWQFTSEGKIDGIDSTGLDMDIEYYDDASDESYLQAPQLTEAVNTKEGNIHITWKEVEGADGYRVYRKEAGKTWQRIGETNGVAAITWIDTDAAGGTDYTYTVRAYDDKVMSPYHSQKTVRCLNVAQMLSAEAVPGGVSVKWNRVKGAEGYYVYRKTAKKTYQRIGQTEENAATSYVDIGAISGENNTYTVLAYYGLSKSNYNTETSIDYLKDPVIESLKTKGSSVEIIWNEIAGANGYRIYRKKAGENWMRIGTTTGAKVYNYTDSAVKNGETYTYTVRACADNMMSIYDDQKQIIFLEQPILTGTATSGGGIQINWRRCSDVTGYIIYRKESNTNWTRIAKISGASLQSYVDDTAESGKVYTYTVRTYKGASMSDYDRKGVSGKYTERLLKYQTTESVYYRTGPGSNYATAGMLSSGQNIELVSGYSKKADGYNWYKLKRNGRYYYIVSNYVKRI